MASKSITPTAQQLHLQKILTKNFDILKTSNPNYSLRSFARKLGVSPTALSEMIHSKRLITRKTILKMLSTLEISPAEKAKIIQHEKSKSAFEVNEKKYITVNMTEHPMLSEWHYFGILALTEVFDFKSDPKWIAERLNIPEDLVKKSLQKLLDIGILSKNLSGELIASNLSLRIDSDINQSFYRNTHLANLELAKNAVINKTSKGVSDFSSMTMSIDHELLPEAQALILQFRRKLAHFLESGKRETVYKLNIQLFPVSSKEDEL